MKTILQITIGICMISYAFGIACNVSVQNCQANQCRDGTDTYCEQCATGFRQKNTPDGVCVAVVANCFAYNVQNTCEVCNTGYRTKTTSDGKCYKEIDNCFEYTADDKCSKCQLNHKKSDDNLTCTTVVLDINCTDQTRENNYTCSTCKTGHVLSAEKTCLKEIPNCKTLAKIYGMCDECNTGYQTDLLKNNCVKKENTSTNSNIITFCSSLVVALLAIFF